MAMVMNLSISQPSSYLPSNPKMTSETFDEARQQLAHADTTIERVAAVRALADFPGDLTTASLIGALFDEDDDVRRAAVETLSQVGAADLDTNSLETLFGKDSEAESVLTTSHENLSLQPILRNKEQDNALSLLAARFDDNSPANRCAAALALRDLAPHQAGELFERIIESSPPDRRARVAEAIVDSGLGAEAIHELGSHNRQSAHGALCFLFLMARLKAVRPLVEAIEQHKSPQVRRALVKILYLNGQSDVAEAAAKRRLGILPQHHRSIYAGL